ncbi:hypothetical protein HZH68_011488 [Vespula germanica]|uniref:Uncharacterized protein n=1 Tax=Vespula germanica TaxID=30212 RepID=A0A834JPW5_VESGE|nr:hypothetical protein HZH68_011488 [Vespula germanica]
MERKRSKGSASPVLAIGISKEAEEVWLSKGRDQNSEEKPGGMGLAITQALSVSIACTVSDRAGVARGMEDGGVSSTTGLTTGDAISRGGPSGPFAFARDFAPSAT